MCNTQERGFIMAKFATLTGITVTALLFAGTNAFAGDQIKSDKPSADMKTTTEMTTETVVNEDATKSALVTFTKTDEDPRVMGAIARGDMVRVQGNDGNVYLNRFVPVSDLPDPELDVDTVDSYTYEYKGRTYTNKVVNEK